MKALKLCAALLPLLIFIGCQQAATSNSTNTANANGTSANTATVATTPTPGVPPIGDNIDESPSDVYRKAHVARQKKDVETLKKIFSKDILEFFTEIGKADGNKSLDAMIREMCEKAEAGEAEVRNEKITGDKATVEYKEKGAWKTMDFVKEDGAWKMTIPKPEPGEVTIENDPKKGK